MTNYSENDAVLGSLNNYRVTANLDVQGWFYTIPQGVSVESIAEAVAALIQRVPMKDYPRPDQLVATLYQALRLLRNDNDEATVRALLEAYFDRMDSGLVN